MTQPAELSAHRVSRRGEGPISFLFSLFSSLFCLNIYFPPPPVSPEISVMGERRRRQLYEISAPRDYRVSSSPANKRKSSHTRALVFRRIKKSSIRDSSISFAPPAPPHFIASHRYLNSAAVVGPSIFCSATGGCRKTRKRTRK